MEEEMIIDENNLRQYVSSPLMEIYHYVVRFGYLLLPLILLYNIYNNKNFYSGEPVNMQIQ